MFSRFEDLENSQLLFEFFRGLEGVGEDFGRFLGWILDDFGTSWEALRVSGGRKGGKGEARRGERGEARRGEERRKRGERDGQGDSGRTRRWPALEPRQAEEVSSPLKGGTPPGHWQIGRASCRERV